jgi:hypothetical protein
MCERICTLPRKRVAREEMAEDFGILAPIVRLLDRVKVWWLRLSTRQKECDLLGNRPLIDFPVGPLWLGHLTQRFPAIPGELTGSGPVNAPSGSMINIASALCGRTTARRVLR